MTPKSEDELTWLEIAARKLAKVKVGQLKQAAEVLLGVVVLLVGLTFYAFLNLRPDPLAASSNTAACNISTEELLTDINKARAAMGIPKLVLDDSLQSVTEFKLNDMITQKYYGHNSLDGHTVKDLFDNAGFTNVYGSQDLDANVNSAADVWKELSSSPEHLKDLVNPQYNNVWISARCGLHYVNVKDTSPESEPQVVGDTTGETITSLVVIHLLQ